MHGLGVERVGLLACRMGEVGKRTFVFHNNYPELIASSRLQRYRRRLIQDMVGFDRFIAISEQVRNWVVSNGIVEENQISVINNGIDTKQALGRRTRAEVRCDLGIPVDAAVLIQVGRFKEQKNQDVSVNAFVQFACERKDVHLIFVGDGPLRGPVESSAEASNVNDRIHFLGIRDDVEDLLAASDVFLMPSSWEGLPISLLEAFANGLPLVGTDVPGITDTVEGCPESVKLVPPRDNDALARAMRAAVYDDNWRYLAGEKARSFVTREYSAAVMVDRYVDLHNRLFGS